MIQQLLACLLSVFLVQYSPPSGGGSSSGTTWFAGSIVAPVPANFTQIGASCAATTITGPTGAAAIQVVGSSGSQNICGMKMTVPAGDFSMVFIFYSTVSSLNFSTVAVGFTDGTKTEWCGVGSGDGTTIGLPILTIAQANALTGGSVSLATGSSSYRLPFANFGGPTFMRLSRTGTNIACDNSSDNQRWVNLFNDTSAAITVTGLYFGVDPRGAAAISSGSLVSVQ